MSPACESCGLPVRIVPVRGEPESDEWHCTNPDCASLDFDQGPRFRGKNYVQQSLLADGSIQIRQSGKESQGESNLDAVGNALAAWCGVGFKWEEANPERDARKEQGIDGYLVDADDNRIAAQVTRMVDQSFIEELAASAHHRAVQVIRGSELLVRIMRIVNLKSRQTPIESREQCILVIDALRYDFMLFLCTAPAPDSWWERVSRWAARKGWREIAVVGSIKTWPLRQLPDRRD